MDIGFDNRVAIVTGAGAGLGREHAMELAARGACVVVNDFGPARDETVEAIRSRGGLAFAHGADVADPSAVADMIDETIARWGRIDILVNNAGILRDRSFAKMELDEWTAVLAVHASGSFNCAKAVWPHMKEANFGRIVMTTSTSGIYGNFGQANYGAAKMAVIGLMNVLHIEGAKHDIRINCLAPAAATQMTSDLLSPQMLELMQARYVTPGVLFLASDDAPSRTILCANSGGFSRVKICETNGVWLPPSQCTAEGVARHWAEISDAPAENCYDAGREQVAKFFAMASTGVNADEATRAGD